GARQIPDSRLKGAGIEKQIIGFVIAIEVRHADHSPVNGQSWSEGAADKSIVIEVPNRGLARTGIVKHIIGLTVPVEVCHTDHLPVSWKSWTKGAADKNVVIEIPNRCLVCNSIVQQIISLAILIEIIRRRRLEGEATNRRWRRKNARSSSGRNFYNITRGALTNEQISIASESEGLRSI